MRGMNFVFIVGTVGRDPEPRTIPSGTAVTELSIATNSAYRKNDQWVEVTTWHKVQVWDRQAEIAVSFLRKGSPVAIQGELRTDSWTDVNGMKRYKTYVRCQRLSLLPGGPQRDRDTRPLDDDTGGPPIIDHEEPRYEAPPPPEVQPVDAEDLPF